jgi:hypothetical protein
MQQVVARLRGEADQDTPHGQAQTVMYRPFEEKDEDRQVQLGIGLALWGGSRQRRRSSCQGRSRPGSSGLQTRGPSCDNRGYSASTLHHPRRLEPDVLSMARPG